ncbi:hypothetical protein [Niallia sp. FSL W8-1348]|uniref:hypothetical protein n=1 Tax=Niallia sp. FSL W8-1348 TaxID=2954656 RepID=UPI000C78FF2C
MAKSTARKKREKVLRENGFDTTMRRGTWGTIVPITKKTKTKQERLTRKEKKYKQNHSSGYDENGFYFWLFV